MDVDQTAEVLGISRATVKRDWSPARAWLNRELVRGGRHPMSAAERWTVVEDLPHRSLDLPASERDALLRRGLRRRTDAARGALPSPSA